MLDLAEKRSEAVDETQLKEKEAMKKTCADCGTSKTPLWRGGPAGPMTLCNACGIRCRKKRGAILGSNKGQIKDKKPKKTTSHTTNSSRGNGNSKFRLSLNQRLLALGREVLMRRSKMDKQQRRMKLGEEEQAAVLLMALSYGSVYA